MLFIHVCCYLSVDYFTHSSLLDVPNNLSSPYQPVPYSSVIKCLDSIPVLFFSRSHIASLSLCSKRKTNYLFSLLLLLAGDISLNPGPVSSLSYINAHCLNIRSVSMITDTLDKPALVQDFILENDIDLLFLTETWLAPDTPPSVLNTFTPNNYSFQHEPRNTGRGGGVGVLFKSCFSISRVATQVFSTFEHILVRLTQDSKSYLFLTVYRPPSTSQSTFLSDFALLLENIASSPSDLTIMGDFNIHVDKPNDNFSSSFVSLLETFDPKQHISEPTHDSDHTLDLLITRNSTNISEVGVSKLFLSDHSAISCHLPISAKQRPPRVLKTIRKYSAINATDFSNGSSLGELLFR